MRDCLRLGVISIVLVSLAACGGPPDPDPGPPAEEVTRDEDAERERLARERAEEARRLCEQADAALAAGNYEEARELYRRAQRDFADTDCGMRAGDELARIDAIEVVRERIHFDFDRAQITEESAAVLRRKAEVLRNHPEMRITIEGHCDERGSAEYNMALGQRRANAARNFLVNLGVSEEMFETVSYGFERPLIDRSDTEAWDMNRRAEFVIRSLGDL